MTSDVTSKNKKVIGYVRVENRDEIFITDQIGDIDNFASREKLDLIKTEHETSNGNQIMRLGLWKTLRTMTCLECDPKTMPMSDDYDHWFREALRPCTCRAPRPASGIIVDDIKILTTQPSSGAKFTLDMCVAKKHLYVVREKRCLSCCNPQAVEFVKRKMLDK